MYWKNITFAIYGTYFNFVYRVHPSFGHLTSVFGQVKRCVCTGKNLRSKNTFLYVVYDVSKTAVTGKIGPYLKTWYFLYVCNGLIFSRSQASFFK